MKKVVSVIDQANRVAGIIIGIVILFTSLLMFYDVLGRYVFGRQTSFGYDLELWLTSVMAFLGGGYALLTKEHIKIDVFHEKYPEKMRKIVDLISYVVVLFVAVVVVYYGIDRVMYNYQQGGKALTGFNVYMWIRWLVVPVGGFLMALQAIAEFIKGIYEFKTGTPLLDPPAPAGPADETLAEAVAEGEAELASDKTDTEEVTP